MAARVEAAHQAALLAVVVRGVAQHLAARRELARAAVHVALGVDGVLARELALFIEAHQAHEDAVLHLLLALELAGAAVLAAHQAGLAGGAVAVGGAHALAVELALLLRMDRRGTQQRGQCDRGRAEEGRGRPGRPKSGNGRAQGHLS
ncbi:hypothetical protein D9M68_632290 [compost metagenome]